MTKEDQLGSAALQVRELPREQPCHDDGRQGAEQVSQQRRILPAEGDVSQSGSAFCSGPVPGVEEDKAEGQADSQVRDG